MARPAPQPAPAPAIDPVVTAVIANRIDGIVREMTNTLLRAARSAVISSARDFSCGICTGDNQLLAASRACRSTSSASTSRPAAMTRAAPRAGRRRRLPAQRPYTGNTQPADHTFLVPVFVDGEHLFTAVAKAHQADIGNSIPSTYHAGAKDVYEEGALIFPSCASSATTAGRGHRAHGAQPHPGASQWYGDFLAGWAPPGSANGG